MILSPLLGRRSHTWLLMASLGLGACAHPESAPPAASASPPSPPAPVAQVAPSPQVPASSPAAPGDDDSFGKHVHEPKLRLGHYSSGDGLTGFVFDRTGPKPKLRMDGTTQAVVLEPRPAPLDQTDLVEQGYGVRIRLGRYGEVTFFRGGRGDSVPVARDADAERLP